MRFESLSRKYNIRDIYVFLFSFFAIVMLVRLISTNGSILRNFLWADQLDTGMDFFHSILCVKDAEPYTRFKTLYPPLANLFYYLMYLCVPEQISGNWNYDFTNWATIRSTGFDLRVWQAPLFLFVLYNISVVIWASNLFRRAIKDYSDMLGMTLIFSTGMLFAWERGNIIIPTMILVLYFILNYRSAGIKKELALISLSVAVGIKLYPVIFSLLLLKGKMYKEFVKVALYSIALVLVPLTLFGGMGNLYVWINVVKEFGAGTGVNIGHNFYGFLQIIMYCGKSIEGLISNSDLFSLLRLFIGGVTITLLSCFWNTEEEWKEYLILTLILVLAQQNSPMYNTIFFLISFIFFINQENMITKDNLWYFVFFVIWLVPIGVLDSRKLYTVLKMASLVILAGSFVVFEIRRWSKSILKNVREVNKI